jgi:sporulation protein YlmC with PRC-barrel domain
MQDKLRRLRLEEMRGAPVYDNAGDKIGRVDEIVYDRQTRVPTWIRIGTRFFGSKRVLVPFAGAALHADGIVVPYTKDDVRDGPDVDDEPISRQYEAELAAYYGLQGFEPPAWLRDADQAMTRAERAMRTRHPSDRQSAARGMGGD